MYANSLQEQPNVLPIPFAPSSSQNRETYPQVETGSTTPAIEFPKTSPVREAAHELKETGAQTFKAAKEAGAGFIAEQKEKIASRIEEYSGGLQTASESLARDGKSNALAAPAEKAADRLKETAEYLRTKELSHMYEDLENFARRRPEVVYGVLFIAGLAAVRFLKASAPKPQIA